MTPTSATPRWAWIAMAAGTATFAALLPYALSRGVSDGPPPQPEAASTPAPSSDVVRAWPRGDVRRLLAAPSSAVPTGHTESTRSGLIAAPSSDGSASTTWQPAGPAGEPSPGTSPGDSVPPAGESSGAPGPPPSPLVPTVPLPTVPVPTLPLPTLPGLTTTPETTTPPETTTAPETTAPQTTTAETTTTTDTTTTAETTGG